MNIVRVKKGDKTTFPIPALNSKEGWSYVKAPEDGIVIELTPLQISTKGLFLSDRLLQQLGYKVKDGNPT